MCQRSRPETSFEYTAGMAESNRTTSSHQLHRADAERDDSISAKTRSPNPAMLVIGACCGAFVFGFVAIIIAYTQMQRIGEQAATIFWVSALFCGALGGFFFPRVGHFLGYCFLVFINLMLALTIGKSFGDQMTLFAIFAFIEYLFFMSRRFVYKTRR